MLSRLTPSRAPAERPSPDTPAEETQAAAPPPEPCAPLFDADWYARRHPETEAPLAHYLAEGSAAASPCPFFSPAWYRAAYPDVAVDGGEPLEHWLAFGWREGRRPSGLFSTELWAGEDDSAADPLSRYLARRGEGPRHHPDLPAIDAWAPDLGLVMVYEGDRAALDLALWALDQGRDGMRVTVYLVDAAETERAGLDRLADARGGAGFRVLRQSEPEGTRPAALANAGLWRAGQGGHSHLGLVGQATILPPGVLAGLVDLWAPIAAPTLNLAETEQAVPVDFDIYAKAAPIQAVAGFLARRQALIPGAVDLVDRLDPACVLLAAGVIERAGRLDPAREGEAALAPVLAAARASGLGPAALARHLYAHKLERSPVHARGPRRAEAVAAARSAERDRAALRRWTADAPALLAGHRALEADAAARAEAPGGEAPCIRFADPPAPPRLEDPAAETVAYRALLRRALADLAQAELASFGTVLGLQPLLRAFAPLFAEGRPVLVLTMDTDPVTGDEKDGYVQRVVAIDRALEGQHRIYLKWVANRDGAPALRALGPRIWRLEVAHGDRLGEALLATLLGLGAAVYAQSLVGLDPPAIRRLLPRRTGPFLVDMHGAVPEEFVLYENHHMAQKYAKHESWAAGEADVVVCVTRAMAAHFAEKLALAPARLAVCPIFLHGADAAAPRRPYNARPRAIYAGGTQRWQCIPELAATVAATAEAVDWTLLTPDTEGMARALARAGVGPETPGLALRSATQAEVFESYGRADFGLLLRDPSVVNRVACPTKLVEYLRFGVVPVLSSAEVGDFAALGMRHVPAEAFRAGELPGPEACAEIAAQNHRVFLRLLEESRAGLARIAALAAAPAAPDTPNLRSLA